MDNLLILIIYDLNAKFYLILFKNSFHCFQIKTLKNPTMLLLYEYARENL